LNKKCVFFDDETASQGFPSAEQVGGPQGRVLDAIQDENEGLLFEANLRSGDENEGLLFGVKSA
jgi:hypothetical protein